MYFVHFFLFPFVRFQTALCSHQSLKNFVRAMFLDVTMNISNFVTWKRDFLHYRRVIDRINVHRTRLTICSLKNRFVVSCGEMAVAANIAPRFWCKIGISFRASESDKIKFYAVFMTLDTSTPTDEWILKIEFHWRWWCMWCMSTLARR